MNGRPKIRNAAVVEAMIDEWHKDPLLDLELHEFLGWSWQEYATWAETGETPE